ncbi:hypothetical protein EXIGLDRAFT_707701 [Exidia glandulosa HHB12029]|uniref:Uncharacterized protein n=1 Tax=Exidia glandulosa HHB12029 TaxID=1314781 RepID=A0A165PKL4_EXIGL|nr:hypothetical protein EXIGLDRAFT_707701 [Exidia glandulosa HHB12029]
MPKPSAANLARFDKRFRTKDAVMKARNGPSLLEARFMFDIKALRNRISAYNSTIARDHMRVEDRHHALAAGCYVDFEPDLNYMHDTNFLWRIYDNAIHDHHFSRHEQDRINPGSVAQNIANGVIYKRRETLGERRGNFLRSCGYPMRVVKLVEDPECVSDDEVDYDENGHKFYDVKDKKYRSARVTSFIKWIDKCILLELAAKGQKQRGREARLRIRSKTPAVAAITTLPPPGVPLDYFDVIAFNAFPPSIRAQYAVKPLIALPESDQLAIQSPAKWKAYSDEEFMLKHGDAILKSYRFPSLDELGNAAVNAKGKSKKVPIQLSEDEEDRDEWLEAYEAAEERNKEHHRKKGKGKGKRRADSEDSDDDMHVD